MRAKVAILTAPRTIKFIEEDLPPVGENDMIIRMVSVGLCHSELPSYLGIGGTTISEYGYRTSTEVPKYPSGIGHEAVAVVAECGRSVKHFKTGDKVAGRVRGCVRDYQYIKNADVPTGSAMIFKIPDTDKDFRLCLSEPLECTVNIIKAASCEYGQRIAVVGCGIMGILAVAGLKKSVAKELTAVDIVDEKLETAKKYGATSTINSTREDPEEAAYRLTEGNFYDIVIEITGSIKGLDTALKLVKPAHKGAWHTEPYQGRGKVLIPSVYGKEEVFPRSLGTNLMLKSCTLHSVHPMYGIDPCGNHVEGIESFLDGRLPIDEMVTHFVPFKDAAAGYEWLINPPAGFMKGIVTFY